MRKILALLLALGMLASLGMVGFAEEMTDVGTPRNQTLIVESQTPTDVPGQFNSYMMGTQMGFGIHQLMSAHLWEMDTVSGEQFGEVAEGMRNPTRTSPSTSSSSVRASSGLTARTSTRTTSCSRST